MKKICEKKLFMKYVTEFKPKNQVCKELGITEEELNAWIKLFRTYTHRSRAKIRRQWGKMLPICMKRSTLW